MPASNSSSGLDEALFGDGSQGGENAKSTKDSIMALFGPGSSGGSQQMFGVPGNASDGFVNNIPLIFAR